jgi:hypothetical protein
VNGLPATRHRSVAGGLQGAQRPRQGRGPGGARAARRNPACQGQAVIAAEWQAKAEALLAAAQLNIADALAWQRDAAKAGAALSREPLSCSRRSW